MESTLSASFRAIVDLGAGGEALPGVENLRRPPASLGYALNLTYTEQVLDGFGLSWLPVNGHTEEEV